LLEMAADGRKLSDAEAVRKLGAQDRCVACASGVGEPPTGSDFKNHTRGGRKSVRETSRKGGRFGLGHSQEC
jgi:hypothetical protein